MNDVTSDFDFCLNKWMVLWLGYPSYNDQNMNQQLTTHKTHHNPVEIAKPNTPLMLDCDEIITHFNVKSYTTDGNGSIMLQWSIKS